MNTNSQRCDYIEVLNSYLIEASSEETEFDVDAIRVRLNFVNQLTEHQFLLNKEYLLNTHPALLFKGLIGVHVPNLPGMTVPPRPEFEMGMDIDGDFNSRGEWVCLADSSIGLSPERKQALEDLLSSGIQVTGYPLYKSDCAPRLYMYGGVAKASMENRLMGESEVRDARDINQKGNGLFSQILGDLHIDYPTHNPFPKSGIQMQMDLRDPKRLEGRVFIDSEMSMDKDQLDRILTSVSGGENLQVDQPAEWTGKEIDADEMVRIILNAKLPDNIQQIVDREFMDYPAILNAGRPEDTERLRELYVRIKGFVIKQTNPIQGTTMTDLPISATMINSLKHHQGFTVNHLPVSPSMINSLKHHPAVVNEQYRSKAFLNVMPASHAEKLMKNMQVMLNLMDESEDPEYYKSVKTEIERLRYIAEGAIKSHRDVDSKWVD